MKSGLTFYPEDVEQQNMDVFFLNVFSDLLGELSGFLCRLSGHFFQLVHSFVKLRFIGPITKPFKLCVT